MSPNKVPAVQPPRRVKRGRLILSAKDYRKLLNQVFSRDGWKCVIPGCGRRNDLHGHHIVFRSQGGDDATWNMVTVCDRCHKAIHDRWILIEPDESGQINANNGVRVRFVNNWVPTKKLRGK